jgi:hypothetical protein
LEKLRGLEENRNNLRKLRKQEINQTRDNRNWNFFFLILGLDWRHGSNGKVLALQVQSPEFEPQYHKKKNSGAEKYN